ncbi:hypothetical protein GCM10009603_28190 [Nocardiopsis exhalans]
MEDLPVGIGRWSTLIQLYLAYLKQRWNEGCTDAVRLCVEICEQGSKDPNGLVVVRKRPDPGRFGRTRVL